MKNFHYFTDAFKKYAEFKGRATRPEFWYFTLFSFIAQIVLSIFDSILGLDSDGNGPLNNLYGLVALLPSLGVGIRRMHDIDKRGWFILIPFYNLYLFCQPGTAGDNRFGSASSQPPASPQETTAENVTA